MIEFEGKIDGPLCYDELSLRSMLRFLKVELEITLAWWAIDDLEGLSFSRNS